MKKRGKILAMFFVVSVIVSIATGQTIYLNTADGPYASCLFPPDGAVVSGAELGGQIYQTLDFKPGATTVRYVGYCSEFYNDVLTRVEDANLGPPPYLPAYRYYVGLAMVPPYTQSLERGKVYYWCVDAIDAKGNKFAGDVWEFTIQDVKAFAPNPPNEAVILGPDVLLSWLPGYGRPTSRLDHDVYIGTDWEDVNNAVYDPIFPPLEYLGPVTEPNILVTGLSENTTYYWRIDEVWDRVPPILPGTYQKGDVWCFKTAGLIAHWKFDEGSGAIAYDSAGDNDGVIYGATWTTGPLDGALDFDGVDDYVLIPNSRELNPTDITLTAWVKVYRYPSVGEFIVWKYNGIWQYSAEYAIQTHTDGRAYFNLAKGNLTNQGVGSKEPLSLGQWYHLAGTYASETHQMKFYADGIFQESKSWPYGIQASTESLRIGSHLNQLYFNGLIDEVRIYDRALSAGEIEELYQSEVPVSETYHVDGVNGDNTNDGLTRETAFATIQRGINVAEDYDTVLVWPGVYTEEINFLGKTITVQGLATTAGVPVLQKPDDFAASFYHGEGQDSVLKNFVIRNSFMAIFIAGSSPTISNLTIVDNKYGIDAYAGAEPDITNSIFWGNSGGDLFQCEARYSCIEEGAEGEGSISIEPLFADANNGDYHLLSERGRYWPQHDIWVLDKVTSPCIDGGDPNVDPSDEPMPNGGRINMGAYGGTAYASMSEWPLKHDSNYDGIVNMLDLAELALEWLRNAAVPSPPPPPPLPSQASNPNPADGATYISRTADLSWTTGSDVTSHDVYFGTSSTPPFIHNQTDTTFDPGTMVYGSTYYWRIDEVNKWSVTSGEVWSFTTIPIPPPPPPPPPP